MKRIAFNIFVYVALTACYPVVMALAIGRASRDFWRTLRLEAMLEHRSYIEHMMRDPWVDRQRILRKRGK